MTEPSGINAADGKACNGRLLRVLWVLMMILTGTFLRAREVSVTGGDWVVYARLFVFGISIPAAFFCLRHTGIGWGGSGILWFYATTMLVSCLACPSQKMALGYWVLLFGGILLTMALVHQVRDANDLCHLERIWMTVMIVIVLKDAGWSLLTNSGMADSIEAQRLGRDVTSPAFLGLYAALVFMILPPLKETQHPVFNFVLRMLLVYVVFASRTRIIMLAFLAGGGVMAWRVLWQKAWLTIFALLGLIVAWLLGGDMIMTWFNRGLESSDVRTLTGRVDIWRSAIQMGVQSIKVFVLGHGYGMTRFYLNWQGGMSPEFFASHCHSAWVEHFFSAGIVGLVAFTALMVRSMRWLTRKVSLAQVFQSGFTQRAAAVVTTFMVAGLTEIPLGGRVNPAALIFFFYVAVLSRSEVSQGATEGWTGA